MRFPVTEKSDACPIGCKPQSISNFMTLYIRSLITDQIEADKERKKMEET